MRCKDSCFYIPVPRLLSTINYLLQSKSSQVLETIVIPDSGVLVYFHVLDDMPI